MTLLRAHQFLIACAIALCLVYAWRQVRDYTAGDPFGIARTVGAVVAAGGLAVYLRWVSRRRPGAARSK